MKITTNGYLFDIDEDGIAAICRETGERSDITDCNGIADALGFEINDEGELAGELDPAVIAERLNDPDTLAEIERRLAEDRAEGSWHEN
jgi:hypothetical protein